MKEKLQQIKDFLFSPTHSRTLGVLLVMILIVGTIVTVQVLPQQTNTQQHASTIGSGGTTCLPTTTTSCQGSKFCTTSGTTCSSYNTTSCSIVPGKCGVAQGIPDEYFTCDPDQASHTRAGSFCYFKNLSGYQCATAPFSNTCPNSAPETSCKLNANVETRSCGANEYCSNKAGVPLQHWPCVQIAQCSCDHNGQSASGQNGFTCNSGQYHAYCSAGWTCDNSANKNANGQQGIYPCKPPTTTPTPKATPTPPPAPKTVTTTNGNLSVTSNSHLCNNNQGVCISSAGSVDPNNKYVVNDTGGQPYDGTSPYTNPRDFTPTTNLSSTCRINCVSIDTATIKGYQDVCQLITANKWHVVKSAQGDCQTFLDTVPTVCCEPGASTQTTPATTPKPTTTPTQAPGCPAGTNCGGGNAPTAPNVCTDKPAQTNLVLSPVCSSGKISEVKANFPAASGSTGYILDWWFHRSVSGKDEYNECAKAFTANGTAVGSYSNNAGGANRELGTSCFDSNATSFGAAYRIETKACTGPSSNPATYIPMTVCQATTVTLNVKLPGIGTAQFENTTPAHPTRNNVGVVIFDQSGNASTRTTTTLTYNSSTGLFVSTPINVGVLPYTTAKEFRVYIGVPQFLKAFGRKDSSKGSIISLTPGIANTVTIYPQPGDIVDARSGNLGQDDVVDASDYNVLRACYNQTGSISMQSGNTTVSVNCADTINFLDYSDGGTTGDEFAANYNAWLRSSIAACSANSKCTGD